MEVERNLLFGVLAAQLRGVPASKVAKAGAHWLDDPEHSLAWHLVKCGAITDDHREQIEQFVKDAIPPDPEDAPDQEASPDQDADEEIIGDAFTDITKSRNGKAFRFGGEGKDPGGRSPKDSFPGLPENPTRYTELGEHGRGGFGRVLSVFDEHLSREIALKELITDREPGSARGSGSTMNPFRARFVQEARITSQLEHPSIVPVYELGRRKNGNLYYTMKFVRGKTLQSAITDAKTLDDRLKLLPHFVDLCQAIAYAHKRGVLHRDIKPVNVMIGEFGETITLDWGLATRKRAKDKKKRDKGETVRGLRLGEEAEATKSVHGEALGTPYYMPPEQALGKLDEIDEHSDVYSLGVVLYEILTGRVPFEGDSALEVLRKVVNHNPPNIASLEHRVPPELAAICHRAIAKKPEDRYASARDLAQEVSRFLAGAVVDAYNYSPMERFVRYFKANWELLTTIAAATAVLVFVGIYSYVRIVDEKNVALMNKRIADDARARAENLAYLTNIRLANEQLGDGELALAQDTIQSAPDNLRAWEWGLLNQVTEPWAYRIMPTDTTESIYVPSYSPDGKRLAVMEGFELTIHDARDGRLVKTYHGDSNRTRNIAWSNDSRHLAGLEEGSIISVYPVGTDEPPRTIGPLTGVIDNLAFLPDDNRLLAWGDSTAGVRLWNLTTGEVEFRFGAHTAGVVCQALLPDGDRVVTSDGGGLLLVWRLSDREVLHRLRGTRFVLDESTQRIFAVDQARIRSYDWNTGEETPASVQLRAPSRLIAMAPQSRRIAATLGDDTVYLFSPDQDTPPVECEVQAYQRQIMFSPDGEFLVVLAGALQVFDARTGVPLASLKGDWTRAWQFDIHPSQPLLAAAAGRQGFPLEVWQGWRWAGERVATANQQAPVEHALFGQEAHWVASLSSAGIAITDLDAHQLRYRARVGIEHGRTVAISPDAGQIALASDPDYPFIADGETGEVLQQLGQPGEQVVSLAYDPTGAHLAVGYSTGNLHVVDTATGATAHTLDLNGALPNSVVYATTSPRLVAASATGAVHAWDTESGTPLWAATIENAVFKQIFFSPDEEEVWLSNSVNNKGRGITVLDAADGSIKGRYPLVDAPTSLSWNASGSRVLATTTAGAWLLDPVTREPFLPMPDPGGRTVAARFARQDSEVLGVTEHGFLRTWPSEPLATDDAYRATLAVEDVPLYVYAADHWLVSGMERLRDALASDLSPVVGDDSTGLQPEQRGHVLAGKSADALLRLGFEAGDRLLTIDQEALQGNREDIAILDRALARHKEDPRRRVQFSYLRNGQRDLAHIVPVPMDVRNEEYVVSAAEAIRLLETKLSLIKRNHAILQEGSWADARRTGDIPEDSLILAGIKAMLMTSPGLDEDLFTAFGLNKGDRVRRIDGAPMTSIRAFERALMDVVKRLRAGENVITEYELERGAFVRIHTRTRIVQ